MFYRCVLKEQACCSVDIHDLGFGKSVPLARLNQLSARACLAGCRFRIFRNRGEWNRNFVSMEVQSRAFVRELLQKSQTAFVTCDDDETASWETARQLARPGRAHGSPVAGTFAVRFSPVKHVSVTGACDMSIRSQALRAHGSRLSVEGTAASLRHSATAQANSHSTEL